MREVAIGESGICSQPAAFRRRHSVELSDVTNWKQRKRTADAKLAAESANRLNRNYAMSHELKRR